MNFKLYVQHKIKNYITSLGEYPHTTFTPEDYRDQLDNHLASKISQSFLFIITMEMFEPVIQFMSRYNQAYYQVIILGQTLNSLGEINLDHILAVKGSRLTRDDLSWYLIKFENSNKSEKLHRNLTSAETQDVVDDQYKLIEIGQMLAKVRNRNELIRKILMTSLKITGADAGCVYLIVDMEGDSKGLLFKYSYTYSKHIDFKEFVMPLDERSIAGFCAVNDEIVNIPDVYKISKSATFSFNKAIDEQYNYISRSMLAVPMKNYMGEMLGVIQLINSKEHLTDEDREDIEAHEILLESRDDFFNKVFPFEVRYEDVMLSVAGQATVALDNIKMIKQLEDQFEGMVRASVDAIDSKDPATSGHSFRVAKMGVKFLRCINDIDEGIYKDLFFTPLEVKQMEYAALLHDYGKVYIDNDIFLKAKKLFPKDFELLKLRLDLIHQSLLTQGDELSLRKAKEISRIRCMVVDLNEPGIFHKNPMGIIDSILKFKDDFEIYDGDNNKVPLLTDEEVRNLQIGRGTLNSDERKEIESHVTYTYNFLRSIPWPKELGRIPEIAGGHHEMLDGSGYPKGLTGKHLSIESRILAILDIFDALSASDRPYKSAVPFEKTYDIIIDEANKGRLDSNLVKLFFDYKIYSGLYSKGFDSVVLR